MAAIHDDSECSDAESVAAGDDSDAKVVMIAPLGCPLLAHVKLSLDDAGRTTLTHLVSQEQYILPAGKEYSIECRPTENEITEFPFVVSFDRTFSAPLYTLFRERLEENDDTCFLQVRNIPSNMVTASQPKTRR